MAGAIDFPGGGYRFLPSVFQFSGGVTALSGHAIERVQFRSPVPLKQGFERIERLITEAGRPLTSFCACELRSPAPFTEQGFRAFNEVYVVTLQKWGLFDGKVNPVARSNVCPQIDAPPEPSFHAFSFTVRTTHAAPSFVIAGSAEAREGGASYSERTVRYGETSAEAMREKARYVLGELERRLAVFGLGWADSTATQVYTVHDLYPFLADEIVRRGAARAGLTWHYARPPVQGLEYEMDCRAVGRETVV
ncbi:MAG TPA: hypothetical protein VN975_08705 [Xanthobacteraceae bacterium]|jgi:hypothetical protein|nr:hypothetical protein [Xanthobacteraceae bacterium]